MRYIISFFLASSLPALAEVPKVVTDISPVHSLVSQVMGDLGTPTLLLDKGADPHSFQLRPSQAGTIADAGLIVWVGPELTPWLERAVSGLGEGAVNLPLLAQDGTLTRAFEAADEDGHDHGTTDPHAWLNPENADVWLGSIAAQLAALDPEHAETYAANAKAAQRRITALDTELKVQLAGVAGKPFIVFHDAYGYFSDHFNLGPVLSVALGDATTPGAARLSALHNRIIADHPGPLCAFPEVQHDPSLMQQVAEGSAIRFGTPQDPEGTLVPPGPDAYEATLRAMANSLTDCLLQ